MFTEAQNEQLNGSLSAASVKTREQGGKQLTYVEGWYVIQEANRIFGFDGWNRETVMLECVTAKERTIGRDKKPGWGVTYIAKVRITVGDIIREGTGSGHGIDVDLGSAHESALKEAETDAMKRALMTFGNRFGLCLYDKSQSGLETRTQPKAVPSQPAKTPVQKPTQKQPQKIGCINENQRKRLFALATEAGYAKDALKAMLSKVGFESSRDITSAKYEEICGYAQDADLAKQWNQHIAVHSQVA